MRISKWGNSLAVRIPKTLVDEMSLTEGDEVELAQDGPRRLLVTKAERGEALAHLEKYRGRMPADYKFDRDEANAR